MQASSRGLAHCIGKLESLRTCGLSRHKLIQNKLKSMQGSYLSNVVNEIQSFCRNL